MSTERGECRYEAIDTEGSGMDHGIVASQEQYQDAT